MVCALLHSWKGDRPRRCGQVRSGRRPWSRQLKLIMNLLFVLFVLRVLVVVGAAGAGWGAAP